MIKELNLLLCSVDGVDTGTKYGGPYAFVIRSYVFCARGFRITH